MQNKIQASEKSLIKVNRFTLLEDAILERERVALDGINRLAFSAKCFIVLESIGLIFIAASVWFIL
jgi:hypothetical protein